MSVLCQICVNYATYSSQRQIPSCTNVPEIYSHHVFEEIRFGFPFWKVQGDYASAAICGA